MKILVTGDKHIGLISDGLTRYDEQKRVLDFIVKRVESADVHIDLGDLFDSPKPSPEAYKLAMEYMVGLSKCHTMSYVIAGNHDKPTRGMWSALDPFEAIEDSIPRFPTVVQHPWVANINDTQLAFIPFVTEFQAKQEGFKSAQELIDTFADEIDGSLPTLAFAHLDVPGSKQNEHDSRQRDIGTHIPDRLVDVCERVYVGHIHKYQVLGDVTIVGSAIHIDFGESNDVKGIVELEI